MQMAIRKGLGSCDLKHLAMRASVIKPVWKRALWPVTGALASNELSEICLTFVGTL